jgi:hypothetical protein
MPLTTYVQCNPAHLEFKKFFTSVIHRLILVECLLIKSEDFKSHLEIDARRSYQVKWLSFACVCVCLCENFNNQYGIVPTTTVVLSSRILNFGIRRLWSLLFLLLDSFVSEDARFWVFFKLVHYLYQVTAVAFLLQNLHHGCKMFRGQC